MTKSATTMPVALEESRVGLFSGWTEEYVFSTKSWGAVKAVGPGLTQAHADLLDFARMFHRSCVFDVADRAVISISLTDYARFRGLKPDPTTHKQLAKDLLRTSVEMTLAGGKEVAFVIADRVDYEAKTAPGEKPKPPRIGKETVAEAREHNRTHAPNPKESSFVIRLTTEFIQFMSAAMSVDYSRLLPQIVRLSDALKRVTRFFLSHRQFQCTTEQLCGYVYPDWEKAPRSTKSLRRDTLRKGASKLKEFGIEYEPAADRWTYSQHPQVFISQPLVKKP